MQLGQVQLLAFKVALDIDIQPAGKGGEGWRFPGRFLRARAGRGVRPFRPLPPGLRGAGKRGPGCSRFLATTLHGERGDPSMWWAASCLLPRSSLHPQTPARQCASSWSSVSAKPWASRPLPSDNCLPSKPAKAASVRSPSRTRPPLPCRCPLCPLPGPRSAEEREIADVRRAVLRVADFYCKAWLLGPQGAPGRPTRWFVEPIWDVLLVWRMWDILKVGRGRLLRCPAGNLGNPSDSCFWRVRSFTQRGNAARA